MEITKAQDSDIKGLIELLQELFQLEPEFEFNSDAHSKGLSLILNNSSLGGIYVAKENGNVLGMINLLFTVSTALGGKVAILEDVVVRHGKRSQGVGSQLIDHAINVAKMEGCLRISLLTGHDNSQAQSFYQKKGFSRSEMVPFRLLIK